MTQHHRLIAGTENIPLYQLSRTISERPKVHALQPGADRALCGAHGLLADPERPWADELSFQRCSACEEKAR